MIARFHYDDETLDRLLHDALRDDEQEVAEHVETCEVCQEKIDTPRRKLQGANRRQRWSPSDGPIGKTWGCSSLIV